MDSNPKTKLATVAINIALRLAAKYWHHYATLNAMLAIEFFGLLYLFQKIDLSGISVAEATVTLAAMLVTALLWIKITRPPRAMDGFYGFAVALSSENEEQRRRIQSDFLGALRSQLDAIRHIIKIDFVELPRWHVERIKGTDTARSYLHKTRCKFLLYGETKIREVQGKEFQVLRMNEVIVHKPIPQEMSHAFSKEMSAVFVGNINLARENELQGLEITSVWFAEAAKYFIGVAALMSGDLGLAQELLEDLRKSKKLEKLKKKRQISRSIRTLQKLVPKRLSDVYFVKWNRAYKEWLRTKDDKFLTDMNMFLELYRGISGESYGYQLQKAIWLFVRKRDVGAAIKKISECKGESDGGWRYSQAFLEAFRGNLEAAMRAYERGFQRPVRNDLPFDVEEFILWALTEYPDKCQFYYCLGIINMEVKRDDALAEEYLKKFIETCPSGQFETAVKDAHRRLVELEQ